MLGFILIAYVVTEWIHGTLQYSIEGYVGSHAYTVLSHFGLHMTSSHFMAYVYALTFLIGLGMMFIGVFGRGRRRS